MVKVGRDPMSMDIQCFCGNPCLVWDETPLYMDQITINFDSIWIKLKYD